MNKRAKLIKFFFKKRINVKLIRNIMHQLKPLRDYFNPRKERSRSFSIPEKSLDYKNNDENRFARKNLHEKKWNETMSQPIKLEAVH